MTPHTDSGHPLTVRWTHWIAATSAIILVGTGLQMFDAFAGGPPPDVFAPPAQSLHADSRWWHLAFACPFIGAGLVYLFYQPVSGNYRQVLFTRADVQGVWPMVRHYALAGPQPPRHGTYNALQKLAYTTVIALCTVLVLSGVVLYRPAYVSPLIGTIGGFRLARLAHVLAMYGLLAFIPGHLLMVVLHGWAGFAAMWTGGEPHVAEPERQSPRTGPDAG